MREGLKVVAAYSLNFVFSVFVLGVLWLLGFELTNTSSELLAGIFTLIVSAAAVLFTSVTDNEELMIAAEKGDKLTYLMSAFTIPIILSLAGLIFSVVSFSFSSPEPISNFSNIFNWVLIIIVIWASFGFTSSVVIIVYLEKGIASKRAN